MPSAGTSPENCKGTRLMVLVAPGMDNSSRSRLPLYWAGYNYPKFNPFGFPFFNLAIYYSPPSGFRIIKTSILPLDAAS